MKYFLILACAFCSAISMSVAFTAPTGGGGCTPTGTLVNDPTSGVCPNVDDWRWDRHFLTNLGKTANFNIRWPDRYFDALTAEGVGRCGITARCAILFNQLVTTKCWPDFYPPTTTAAGRFSVVVQSYGAHEDPRSCSPWPATELIVWCDAMPQVTFYKDHACGGGGGTQCLTLTFDGGEPSTPCECDPDSPECASPILIDVRGDGFQLCGAEEGVQFDIRAEGAAPRISWTAQSSDDAWLALDRNGNGAIDDGSELFGNHTTQPQPTAGRHPNGFLALAMFDEPNKGGNGDGSITAADAIFPSLRLWRDRNHNGVSEAEELMTLQAGGVASLDLSYKDAKKKDEYGNYFRYRGKVEGSRDADVSRWAWDVFLVPAASEAP